MASPQKSSGKNDSRERKQAAAELRQRGSKNVVFGAVAAIVGAVLTMWSNRGVGDMGLSVTQLIYWGLIGGGALELAVGVWQVYLAREVGEGRAAIPDSVAPPPSRAATETVSDGPLELRLRPTRGRHIGWGLAALALGAFFFFAVGGAGVFIGVACFGWCAYHSARLIVSVALPAQTIKIDDDQLQLPRSAVGRDALRLPPAELKRVFFLRRAAPFGRQAPVLVIDVGDQSLLYPRDWFAGDLEQERLAAAVRARLPSQ